MNEKKSAFILIICVICVLIMGISKNLFTSLRAEFISLTSLRAERSNPEGKGTMLILILDCFARNDVSEFLEVPFIESR